MGRLSARSVLLRATAGTLFALLLLLAMEGAARLVFGAPSERLRFDKNWNGEQVFVEADGLLDPVFQNQYAIAPFPPEPAPGTRRVLTLGGSSVNGGTDGRPGGDFSARLALALSTEASPVEVLNLGRPGIDSSSMRHVVLGVAETGIRADAALLYLGHNDLGNLTQRSDASPSRDRGAQRGAVLDRFRLTHSMRRLAAWLRPQKRARADRQKLTRISGAERAKAIDTLRANVTAIATTLSAQGMRVAVVPAIGDIETFGPLGLDCVDDLPKRSTWAGIMRYRYEPAKATRIELDSVIERNPDCAAAYHLRGRVRLLDGDRGGYDDLWRALDLDPVAMRATTEVQGAIREAAALGGAMVIDLPGEIRATLGVPPAEWFVDEVHFSFAGHQAVTSALAPHLAQALGLEPPPDAPPLDPTLPPAAAPTDPSAGSARSP